MLVDYVLFVVVFVMSFFGFYVFREVYSKYMCDLEKFIVCICVFWKIYREYVCVYCLKKFIEVFVWLRSRSLSVYLCDLEKFVLCICMV